MAPSITMIRLFGRNSMAPSGPCTRAVGWSITKSAGRGALVIRRPLVGAAPGFPGQRSHCAGAYGRTRRRRRSRGREIGDDMSGPDPAVDALTDALAAVSEGR